jgi:hypothetical protein
MESVFFELDERDNWEGNCPPLSKPELKPDLAAHLGNVSLE